MFTTSQLIPMAPSEQEDRQPGRQLTSLPNADGFFINRSVVYNGYIYTIGGDNSDANVTNVEYIQINNGGGLSSSWTQTSNPVSAAAWGSTVAYNGFVYIFGGSNGDFGEPPYTIYVQYAPILSGGNLGPWTQETASYSLRGAANAVATAVVYNGYVMYLAVILDSVES